MKYLLFSFGFCLMLTNSLLSQVTITLPTLKDAAIGYHDGASTAGNNYGFAIQNAAFAIPATASIGGLNVNRALIDFDLSLIPSGATVISALMNLYVISPYGSYPGHIGTANAAYLERITQPWLENTATWNNQPTSVALNQVNLANSTAANQNYLNINVTSLVNDMLANPSTSFGFKLRMVAEAATNILVFASKDHSNISLRPTLVVTYTVCSNLTISAAPSTVICSGAQTSFTATGSGTAIQWFSATAPSTPVATGSVFTSPTLTTALSPSYYTYSASIVGCSGSSNISVKVNPLPQIFAAASNQTICSGKSVTLSASGANSYLWLINQIFVSASSSLIVNPTSNVTYTINGTDANGCTGTSTLSVVVNPLPIITTSASSQTICTGQSVTLTANGANSYNWIVNQNTLATTSTLNANPTSNQTYMIEGTDGNGCKNTSSLSIVVNPLPIISASASKQSVCMGQKVTLTATGAITYTWLANLTIAATTPSFNIFPTSSLTYTINGTNSKGCVGSNTLSILVSECVGIQEASPQQFSFDLFPNPCQNKLQITRNFISVNGDFYEIKDLNGKILRSQKVSEASDMHDFLELDLESGIYFCAYISLGKPVQMKKFLVNK